MELREIKGKEPLMQVRFRYFLVKPMCNPPENPEQLLVENSTKLKEGSFLCEHQDTATARYWRF